MIDWSFIPDNAKEFATAGIAGSAVSIAMEWTGFLPAVRKMVVGTLCALYLSPLAVPLLTWALAGINVDTPAVKSAGLSGFIMGVVGIILIEIVMKTLHIRRDRLGDDK